MKKKRLLVILVFQLGLMLNPVYASTTSSGSTTKKKHTKKHKVKHARKSRNYMEGQASFYAPKFNGRKMANGDRYWDDIYSAAHARLPLGTKLKVTNIDDDSDNGKVLYVEVTDRMSSHSKYILDLSPAAAKYLNGSGRGLRVKLQIVNNAEFESHDMNRDDLQKASN